MICSEKILYLKSAAEKAGCVTKINEPMSAHTTFKVGGCCDIMIFPNSVDSLKQVVAAARNEGIDYYILGNGSNVLFSDIGYRGAVIVLGNDFSQITADGNVITAYAGAMLHKVGRLALDRSLTGMEFSYGIPGTVGGAIYMNAGAYGGEMKDIVTSVTCIDKDGDLKTYIGDELKFGYRKSRFTDSDEIIVSADFTLEKGDCKLIKAKMDELMERRRSRQPLEYPSAGSTFKRPEGSYAGLVIEESGLKGYRVGDAQISEKHANFVINRGNATASDIMKLIDDVKKTVKEKTGYELECEINVIGSDD